MIPYGFTDRMFTTPLLVIIANSDLQHGLEFDCNQEVSHFRGLIDLNSSCIWQGR